MVFDMIFYKQSQPWLEKNDISRKITIIDLEQHIIDLNFSAILFQWKVKVFNFNQW